MNTDYLNFVRRLDLVGDRDYLGFFLAVNLAPTLSNLKPSVMVNLRNQSRMLKDTYLENKKILEDKLGLSSFVLQEKPDSLLVLFYDTPLLSRVLNSSSVQRLLVDFGYSPGQPLGYYLRIVKSRFMLLQHCPNEIGLFLGYPPEDVQSFHCQDRDCLFTGYWKCYNHIQEAQETCASYDRAKLEMLAQVQPLLNRLIAS